MTGVRSNFFRKTLPVLFLIGILGGAAGCGCGKSDSGGGGNSSPIANLVLDPAALELDESNASGLQVEIAFDIDIDAVVSLSTVGDLRINSSDDAGTAAAALDIDVSGTTAVTVYLFAADDADHADNTDQVLIITCASAVNSPNTSLHFTIRDDDFDLILTSSQNTIGEGAAFGIPLEISSDNPHVTAATSLNASGDLRLNTTNNPAGAQASLPVDLDGTNTVTVYLFAIADADLTDDVGETVSLTCAAAGNSPQSLTFDISETLFGLAVSSPGGPLTESDASGIAFTVALDQDGPAGTATVTPAGELLVSLTDNPAAAAASVDVSLNGTTLHTVYVFAPADNDYEDEAGESISIAMPGAFNSPVLITFDVIDTSPWISVGPGGGGGMFSPASSPHDANLMFMSCDMGGFYRSQDGGYTWRMYGWKGPGKSNYCRVRFHPVNANILYFKGYCSTDGGDSWDVISVSQPFGANDIRDLCIGPAGRIILARSSGTTYISRDSGSSWSTVSGGGGGTTGMLVDAASSAANRTIYIATNSQIRKSVDDGVSWSTVSGGLPWTVIRSFAGASDSGLTRTSLYCVIEGRNSAGSFDGGVYISTDGGTSWSSAMGSGINATLGAQDGYADSSIPQYHIVQCAEGHPDEPAVSMGGSTGYWPPWHRTIYTTDDAGANWSPVWYYDFRFVDFNVDVGWLPRATSYGWGGFHTADGFTMNPADPDVMMITNSGEIHVTTDGGAAWRQAFSYFPPAQPPNSLDYNDNNPGRWSSIGLEVTTCWKYVVDPHDYNRHIICYTDIGMMVSDDAGQSWTHGADGSPWGNTTYDLVFDPDVADLCWAAMSSTHDIPNWGYTDAGVSGSGGVCVSSDAGATWTNSTSGLPDDPVTCIELDPTSPAGSRTLYCAVYTRGFYKSTDNGAAWSAINTGIDLSNDHAYLIRRHPDGTLFACITGRRTGNTFSPAGALYRSTNGGTNWTNITLSNPILWPIGFASDPRNSNVVYIASAATPGGPGDGGVYRTQDGGATWEHVIQNAEFAAEGGGNYTHSYFLKINPHDPDHVFLTGNHGVWDSKDGGDTWRAYGDADIPFYTCLRITFDPVYDRLIYVTTFGGGVWKGLLKD